MARVGGRPGRSTAAGRDVEKPLTAGLSAAVSGCVRAGERGSGQDLACRALPFFHCENGSCQ